ncbi:MAG TPA: RluA family pseudouridine synthase [Deferrisomatales bacterium]|nr:RluA family pseudouridine synthase [Deferrisomatales bacterium]
MSTDGPQTFDFVATTGAGRVDRYLASRELPVSRNRIQQLIAAGQVTVDGGPVRPSHKLRGGEQLRVTVPPPQASDAAAEDLPLELAYEDDHLAVVIKPRGLVVHPAPGHPSGTLVNALLHRCNDLSGVGGVLRPGIVHRLDKDTSGLLVVAKDDATHQDLQEQFRSRSVRKEYLAVVLGRLTGEGEVDEPIGRHPTERKKMAVGVARGRPACTKWRALQALGGATLVAVRIETGRTHQIRVHMASLGHPVVGDPLYGGTKRAKGIGDPAARRRLLREDTQALHAWKLSFRHPSSGEELSFCAPPPAELAALIQDLGGEPTSLPVG